MVEGGGLENRFPGNRNGGSNPSPSATFSICSRFTSDEVEDFIIMLKSGALPAGIKVVEMKNL